MVEREMQELLWHHPERLLTEPLKAFAWETSSSVGRADLVFEDRLGRLLIIEVKYGKLGRGAIDQLLDYFGMMKDRFPNRPVELMVVAHSIPPERRLTCESRDIECREISEKRFREVAAEVGYTFRSEVNSHLEAAPTNTPHNGGSSEGQQRIAHSQWAYQKATISFSDAEDFLSRCDAHGRNFFAALFNAQRSQATQTRITWNHESGFSLQFYFHRIGLAPMVWGFPARNREGRNIQQRLHFPFDFSIKAGVPEAFINEFGASLSSVVPFSGGGRRPSLTIDGLSPADEKELIDTIFDFAAKASAK
jgi:hypothetical protein